MKTEYTESYERQEDGTLVLVKREEHQIDVNAEIENKEAELLKMYQELEALKAQQNQQA